MYQEIVVAGVGLIFTALTGGTALGVRRLLGHTDELKGDSKKHGEAIAAMQVMMPNGEWKELKNSVASVHGTVREVQTDVSGLASDFSELKIEFREHAATEKDRMCEAIAETYPKLRPIPVVNGARRKKKAKR